MRRISTLLTCLALSISMSPATAQSLKIEQAPDKPGFTADIPDQTHINCNPSDLTGKWTCKCDTDGGCTLLGILCTHVDGKYYTCENDETTSDSEKLRKRLKKK